MNLIEWLLLAGALGAFTITEQYRPYVTGGAALLALAAGVRVWRRRRLAPRTGLELPWLLFVLSAGLATWAAYDRPTALLQFFRILAAAALFYAVIESDAPTHGWVAIILTLMAAGLALYWPTLDDFTVNPGKLAVITTLRQWLNSVLPNFPGPSIHGNVAGGTLALAAPFGLALAWDELRQRKLLWGVATIGLAFIIVFGLFLTSSRGGWLGLAAALGLSALAWGQRRWLPNWRVLFWGVTILIGVALVAGLVATGNLERLLGTIPDPAGTLQKRPDLWAQGLPLIRDYPFTGSGLMTFRMVFATYGILIHTPFHDHIHNAYLEVWIEQGLGGVLALAWGGLVVLGWAWRALRWPQVPLWGWAGLAAVATAAVHGIFDVVFYVERTLPLIGLALGYAYLASHPPLTVGRRSPVEQRSLAALHPAFVAGAAAAGVVSVLWVGQLLYRPVLAAWHANLGCLTQTRLELIAFDPFHFDDPTLDDIRRQSDLIWAEGQFRQALAWDAQNVTALQRLAQIALSRGEYAQALDWIEVAWQAGPHDPITRLLRGDALAANGQLAAAAESVRGLAWAEPRLMFQAWYRYWVGADYRRAADAWAVVLLLNPANSEAARWKLEAESKDR